MSSTPLVRPAREARGSRLGELADATPDSRNRVVDFLRAAAILVVVLGHWTVAAVYVDEGGDLPVLHRADLLELATWTHPLTWVVQVMPVFFLVGGYSNALSWRSAAARGTTYGGWLRGRLRRLTIPVLPLMVFWAVVAPVAHALGASGETLRIASRASLVPTWFLAAYVVVVSVAPLTLRLWERWGWATVGAGLALGGLVDFVSIGNDLFLLGFVNYLVVWAAVHQLGYAWLDGDLAGTGRRLLLALVGLVGLLLLVRVGPYGVSMVGVGGHGVNNAYPTRVTLGFLGLLQAGAVLALEPALARLTARRRVWMATILVNSRIMTVYLWHLTALGIVVAVSLALDGAGLREEPLTSTWWLTRPVWFAVLGSVTAVFVLLLGRVERVPGDDRPAPPALLPLLSMAATCAALGLLADWGIAADDGTVRWYLPLVPVLGAMVFGVLRPPLRR